MTMAILKKQFLKQNKNWKEDPNYLQVLLQAVNDIIIHCTHYLSSH